AQFAPSRRGRWPVWRKGSSTIPQEPDEDLLERALVGVEVLELDPRLGDILEKLGDAGVISLGVIGEDELAAAIGDIEAVGAEPRGYGPDRLGELERELLLAELAHELVLVLDQNELALRDDPDAVGHLLRFLDVVGRQDDRDAALAQRA